MGKLGRRGPHRERKNRIADDRERERIAACARREFRRQEVARKDSMKSEEDKRRDKQISAMLMTLPSVLTIRARDDLASRPNT